MRDLLARVGKNNVVWGHTQAQHLLQFIFASAVESSPKICQRRQYNWIVIAFYSYTKTEYVNPLKTLETLNLDYNKGQPYKPIDQTKVLKSDKILHLTQTKY